MRRPEALSEGTLPSAVLIGLETDRGCFEHMGWMSGRSVVLAFSPTCLSESPDLSLE